MQRHTRQSILLVLALIMVLTGCRAAYYSTWEKFGKEKRHLLRDNVKKVRSEQQQASEQFQDVLTRLKSLYGFDGGDLEKAYDKLKDDYEESEERAEAVRDRIENVEQIAKDLFNEWQQEIDDMQNADLREKSIDALNDTRTRYSRMQQAMRNAERQMQPVLQQVHDYVLYLKHNLNALAVGALRQEVDDIELEVDTLIRDMNRSIQEAESFLRDFE